MSINIDDNFLNKIVAEFSGKEFTVDDLRQYLLSNDNKIKEAVKWALTKPSDLEKKSDCTLKDQKKKYSVSDYQKSERDFAFIVDKKINVQDLVDVISNVDKNLISNIKVFDVYEGDNIPENQKSIAISVTIQSQEKTLKDADLDQINKSIIETVENKTGAKIRS